jgi:ribosome-binding protein aMBF1 (putative translation factor)
MHFAEPEPAWADRPFARRGCSVACSSPLNVTHSRYTYSLHAATVAAMKKRARLDVRERFGYAVKLRREALSLTQEDLADKAGIHRTYLSDVERGSRNLGLENIERLALALRVRMSELFRIMEQG